MGRLGKPLDAGDGLGVSLPLVYLPLGDEALGRRVVGLEVDPDILRNVEERPALVVTSRYGYNQVSK